MHASLSSVCRSLALPALARIRMGSTDAAFRLLFCDVAFKSGSDFTTQELADDASIEVGPLCPVAHALLQRLLQTDSRNDPVPMSRRS